jgi:hypothetical protein
VTFPDATGFTVTFTVEAALAAPSSSVTRSENVNVVVVAADGVVKVGFAAVVLESVTAVPAVCDQV